MIAVLDFGSQYTQLIARRLRSQGFAAQVLPGSLSAAAVAAQKPDGIILSGSPASVGTGHDPDPGLFDLGIPLLGLCFGYQFLAQTLGGKVAPSSHREYGPALVQKSEAGRSDPLTLRLSPTTSVWMSHGDSVVALPPGALLLLESVSSQPGQAPTPAAFTMPGRRLWGLQFHPEVYHTPEGKLLLEAFARDICHCAADWNLRSVLGEVERKLHAELREVPEVVCAVSGGVDSTVMAVLLSRATRVRALFVDHGFLRAYDVQNLRKVFSHYPSIALEVVDARDRFLTALRGVADPETKRKLIGRLFVETFSAHVGRAQFTHLAQGTIYSDVIESAHNQLATAHTIKSHHNVGGFPPDSGVQLFEPLRPFFKDEVREIGALLGIDPEILHQHPFPGPGLAIRCLGEIQPERVDILRHADAIFHDELVRRNLYHQTWQAFVVLLPVRSVGVMGDGRSYEYAVCIRAVSSVDAMTAEATELPLPDLKSIATRIVNEVRGVNRVVFDLTSKPPGTIEWE